jgi:hypothetical protein
MGGPFKPGFGLSGAVRSGSSGDRDISIVEDMGHFNCAMTTFTFSLDMQSELWEALPSSAT